MSSQPLTNITIATTRALHQEREQRILLEAAGATVVHYPCIAIAPPNDIEPLDNALRQTIAGGYDWLIVTSTNTVHALAERLRTLELTLGDMPTWQVAAVGSSTASAIQEQLGVSVNVTPTEFTADALGEAIPNLNSSRIFLPQSAIAEPALVEKLQLAGATVDPVVAYRTLIAQSGDDVLAMLWEGTVDAITFTSASTVHNFVRRVSAEKATLAMLDDVCVACIGPSTAAAAQQLGLSVAIIPDEHTLQGLTGGLIAYFQEER